MIEMIINYVDITEIINCANQNYAIVYLLVREVSNNVEKRSCTHTGGPRD